MNCLCNQRGLGLIEVLSAIALFAVVATGLSSSGITSIKLNNQSRTAAAATALMLNKIEHLRTLIPVTNTVPADLALGAHDDPNNPITALGQPNGTFTRSWNVVSIPQYYNGTVVGVVPSIVQVAVTVSWTQPQPGRLTAVTYACTTLDCG